jgi:transposase
LRTCRLRWYLHELDPASEPKTRSLDRISALEQVQVRVAGLEGAVAGLGRLLAARCQELSAQINELTALTCAQAPALIAMFGCGTLTAAKILGETAGVDRFRSKDA